jgi:hypothetical protein
MERASRSGLMAHATKVNGAWARPMVRASCITQTAICTKETGKMTKQTVTGPTLTQMALNTSDSGKTTSNMGSDLSPGLTVQFTRVTIVKVRNTAKDGSLSLTALCTRVSFT